MSLTGYTYNKTSVEEDFDITSPVLPNPGAGYCGCPFYRPA